MSVYYHSEYFNAVAIIVFETFERNQPNRGFFPIQFSFNKLTLFDENQQQKRLPFLFFLQKLVHVSKTGEKQISRTYLSVKITIPVFFVGMYKVRWNAFSYLQWTAAVITKAVLSPASLPICNNNYLLSQAKQIVFSSKISKNILPEPIFLSNFG